MPFEQFLLKVLFIQVIHGSTDLRQFADLDILISATDAEKAWALLISHEFLPELNLTPKQRTKYIKTEDNISFLKQDSG